MFSQNGQFCLCADGGQSNVLYGWHPSNVVYHKLLTFDTPGEDPRLSPPSNDGTRIAWLESTGKICIGRLDPATPNPHIILERNLNIAEPLFRTLRFSCDQTRVIGHIIHGFPAVCTVVVWDLERNIVLSAIQPEPIHSQVSLEVHPTDRNTFLITQLCSFIAMDSPPHTTIFTTQAGGEIVSRMLATAGDHAVWEESGEILASWSAKDMHVYSYPSMTLLRTFSLDEELRSKLSDPVMATILRCYFAWESQDVPVVFVEFEDLDPESKRNDIPTFRQFITPVYLGRTILQDLQVFDLGSRGSIGKHKVSSSTKKPHVDLDATRPFTVISREIPDIVWVMILEKLDPVSMLRVSGVSRLFNFISMSEAYWKVMCMKESPLLQLVKESLEETSWREFYWSRLSNLDGKLVITQGPPGYFASFVFQPDQSKEVH